MGTGVKKGGFTVIEVMLFFAASAVLAAAIFGTSMLNINQQRYADAVRNFKALVQEQYINTTRVQNPSGDNSLCPNSADPDNPITKNRGANDCLVIGKLFSVTGSTSIVIRNIVAEPPEPEKYTTNGVGAIGEMTNLTVVNAGAEELSPAWSTSLLAKLPAEPLGVGTFSLAIIRSPATGTPYTFFMSGDGTDFQPDTPESIGEDISSLLGNQLTNNLSICVDPLGLTLVGRQAVIIDSRISGPSGVRQGDYTC